MSQWRLLALILTTLSIAAAIGMMWPIFGSPQLIVVGTAALLVGTGLAVLGWWRKWSAVTVIAFGIVAFLGLAPSLAAPDRVADVLPTLAAFRVALPAAFTSWRDILTLSTPVGTTDGMLVAPLILVLAGSAIAASIVLRSQRAEFAGIVPAVLGVWAILWGPQAEFYSALFGLIVLAGIVGIVTVVRQARRRRAAPRTISSFGRRMLAGVSVAVAAILVGSVSSQIALRDRVVLREDTPIAIDVSEVDSPLAAFRSYLLPEARDATLFTITGTPEDAPITLAVLDAYDGEVASLSGASFRRMTEVPAAGTHLGITVQGLSGPWVPHLGAVEAVTFIGAQGPDLQENAYLDTDTGALLDLAGLQEGDAFDITVSAPQTHPPLTDLTPRGTPQLGIDPPENAISRLTVWTSSASTPGERLQALVDGFQRDGYVSHGIDDDGPVSRAGHSLARIQALFDGVMIGDGEQYAVAAALLAEQLGFPARVVVGFQPQSDGEVVEVVGGDIDAWIEVSTNEAGWVPVHVTPPDRAVPEEDDVAPNPVGQPAQPLPPVQQEGGQTPENVPAPPVQPENVPQEPAIDWAFIQWVAAGIGVLLLLLAPIALIVGAKSLRRRRRRKNFDEAMQVDGAWREFVDAAVDRGRAPQSLATRLEYAVDAEERAFARHIDATLFGARPISDEDVIAVWQHKNEVLASLDERRSRWHRLRSWLSPRSLVRAQIVESPRSTGAMHPQGNQVR